MAERMFSSLDEEFGLGVNDQVESINSENPPYNPYLEYLSSCEAGFTRVEVTDMLTQHEIDQGLDELVDGFQVK
jgi:hypothetical protein